MCKFKTDDSDNNKDNRNKTNNMVRVTKENNSSNDGSCSTNACPYSISGSYWNLFHRLRDGKETQDDKNHRNDTGNQFAKSLAVLQRNRKTDFEEPSQQ